MESRQLRYMYHGVVPLVVSVEDLEAFVTAKLVAVGTGVATEE